MTNKILIYQEFSLYNFGLANSLQNIPDNEIIFDNYREQFHVLADVYMKKIKQHKQHYITE